VLNSFNATSFDEAETQTGGGACSTSEISPGVLVIDTTAGGAWSHYVVTVTADNKRGLRTTFTQIIEIDDTVRTLSIKYE